MHLSMKFADFPQESRNVYLDKTNISDIDGHDHEVDVDVIDFLRGPKVEQLRLQGVEHVYHITALEGKIYFRSYRHVLL